MCIPVGTETRSCARCAGFSIVCSRGHGVPTREEGANSAAHHIAPVRGGSTGFHPSSLDQEGTRNGN